MMKYSRLASYSVLQINFTALQVGIVSGYGHSGVYRIRDEWSY